MELFKAEAEGINKLIQEWLKHDNQELECTFGKGTVDATTFFQVAQRIRSKNITELPLVDRLNIVTPEYIRFTIEKLGLIQKYCKEDTLDDIPYTAMIKDRSAKLDTLDIKDYEIRIKSRQETGVVPDDPRIIEMLGKWPIQRKGFRLIRRWSFTEPGLQYDLSIVRSTTQDSKGFNWQKKFTDQNISGANYMYEIEVELQRVVGDTVDSARKRLIKGIGEVLRGIQKNTLLIRKNTKHSVLELYRSITKTDKFIGCKPVTLVQSNFTDVIDNKIPNIRTGYNVTDKADGLRTLAFCTSNGELYLIDMGMNVYRTGLRSINNRESIVDGEWVTRTIDKKPVSLFLAFDIYYDVDKKIVSNLPFYNKDDTETRYAKLKKWTEAFNKNGPEKLLPYLTIQTTLEVSIKSFSFAKDIDIFKHASKILSLPKPYYTDGLIFTPNSKPLPGYDEAKQTIRPGIAFKSQFKWKPPTDNTVDFLVRFEKDPLNKSIDLISYGIKPETGETIRYKTIRLYVGSNDPLGFNPRDIILNERKVETSKENEYKAVPFYPKQFSDSMASVCYLTIYTDNATKEEYVATKDNNEPIQDESIVEMSYDTSMPDGWQWTPLRIRHDKTERLHKSGLGGTLNFEDTANDVWNSIKDPIDKSMISTGSSEPTTASVNNTLVQIEKRSTVSKNYFVDKKPQTKDTDLLKGMRNFHNKFIKEIILYNACMKGGKSLIDLGCGKGSDIRRWDDDKASFVLGIDYSSDNITNTKNGAYERYLDLKKERVDVTPMVFVIGDTSKRIIDGKAGDNEEESDILRSVFGTNPKGRVPSYVDKTLGGILKNGADTISCMFALHYFFENKEKLNGILRNIRENLKVGGYFVGCCFDGESVFDFLKNTPTDGTRSGVEKDTYLWKIRKDYDEDVLPYSEDSLGLKINVEFLSIGMPHDEYLVSFPYFIERMKEIGCELVSDTQAKELGLQHGTELFGKSYEKTKDYGKSYSMIPALKEFSFLNRWFIFVRTVDVLLEEDSVEGVLRKSLKESKLNSVLVSEAAPTTLVGENGTNLAATEEVAEEEREEREEREGESEFIRTIPVIPSSAGPQKKYSINEIFKFYFDAPLKDYKLGINDNEAARYISPQTPFPIRDFDNPKVIYPSIEHFMAAMMYKYGTNKPDIAVTLFSSKGSIHQEFLRKRTEESHNLQKAIPYEKDHELLNNEITEIKAAIRPAAFKKYGAVYNETNYIIKKDELLRKAVEYRYRNDERMIKILNAAKMKNKYLLYDSKNSMSADMGGIRKVSGIIEGSNKLGKLYMELAGFINIIPDVE